MKRCTIKQTIDISIIQDFVLNERNIERILQHMIKGNEQVSSKSKTKIKKVITKNTQFLLPKFVDTLFWCYYIICNGISAYEMVHGDGFKDSLEMKIQLVYSVRENKELLKKNKWKKNAIEDELVNHKTISVSAFMCICAISNFNVVYIDDKKMYTLLNNEDITTNLNIIEKTTNGYSIFIGNNAEIYQKYTQSREQLWQIDNLTKPLRGISSYKAKDLQEICHKLHIDINNDKKMPKKKSLLYQMIQEHL
jgi:hypothetical protein